MTDGKTPDVTPTPLLTVRATVNLNGLRAGTSALVDPREPYIASLLEAGYLTRTAAAADDD